MYFMYLYFMYFALSVTAAVGTAGAHAQTAAGFAPANEQEFDNRFVGGRIEIIRELDVDDIPGTELLDAYVEFLPNRRFAQVAIYRYSGDHPINVEIAVIRRGDDALLVDTGRYSYRRTVPNTGTITVVFDGGVPRIENGVYVESLFDRGDTCNTEQTFSSRVHGTFQTSGTDCAPGTGSWRLRGSDSEPEFGSRDIGDLRFIENQAITPLALPQADSGDTPLTYRVHPALPAGLTFDSGTRALSGTPTAPVARSTYSYTVTDADGDSASLTFTITVSEATVQEALTSYDNFHVIAHDLSEGQSHDAECKIQLGNGVRLADWDDIVDYHEGGGSLLEFIVGLKMSVEGQEPLPGEIASGYRISRGGEPVEGGAVRPGARHYFFARHDHRRPGHFLAHDHLDNYRLSLGSWHGTGGHALCYGKLPMVEPPQSASDHTVPFVPGASDGFRQGLVRVINHGAVAGEVRIDAFDDAGNRHGPLTLALDGGEAAQFSSGDLEDGNTAKGLTGQTGPGEGNWRLELRTDLDVEVLAYVRTADGFLTAMHDTVPGAGNRHRVALFNPGRNHSQVSLLRLVNPGGEDAEVAITGVDDAGRPAGPVNVTVPAGAAQTFSAQDLESGGGRLSGALGAGAGKWRLTVVPSQPVFVMNLLRSPTGHLANLSTTAAVGSGGTHVLPLIPAKSTSGREGFVRVVNRSGRAGEVRIAAFDDAGQEYGPLTLALAADATVHFSSGDLEDGNAAKGLAGRIGAGEGDWRLELRSDLDIEALAYVRTNDGFLTAAHDVAPGRGPHRSIPIFNPGSNRSQVSLLRLVNPTTVTAHATITGIDDAGEPGGSVQVSIPAGAARTFSAQQLESGEGTQGALGDGAGKWRLEVASEQPIIAMSLLRRPTGHLTNLSTSPGARRDSDLDGIPDFVDMDDDNDGVPDAADAFPLDPSEWADSDGDGVGDNADSDDGAEADDVVLRGRAMLGGVLAGADVVASALNGVPVARAETSTAGEFTLSLGGASIPEIVLFTAYGGEDQDAGADGEPAVNKGRLHAFVTKSRLLDGRGVAINISPLTEIVYQEAKSRYPDSGPSPTAAELSAFLDDAAGTYLDGDGGYAAVLSFDIEVDRHRSKLDWNFIATSLAAAVRTGAGGRDIANRVSALASQFDEEGVEDNGFELRRVSGRRADRVVTVARPGDAVGVNSIRQTFIDDDGAFVDASLIKVTEDKSRVSINISYAGRTFSISGSSGILKEVPFTAAALEEFASRIVTLSVRESDVVIDIDKSLSTAISDGELVFRVDGRTPRKDEVIVLQDDPRMSWNWGAPIVNTNAELKLKRIDDAELDNGEKVPAWTKGDTLIIRIPDRIYDELTGLDRDLWRTAFKNISLDLLTAVAGAKVPPAWVISAVKLYSAASDVHFLLTKGLPTAYEVQVGGTHVMLREYADEKGRSGAESSSIKPGSEYWMDMFFRMKCRKSDTRDGKVVWSPCENHVSLGINVTDTFVYESHELGSPTSSGTVKCPTDYRPPTSTTKLCQRRHETGYSFPVVEFEQSELPLGNYWMLHRPRVVFELIDWKPRASEGLASAHKTLELSDNIGLYSHERQYKVDLSDVALLPDFHAAIDEDRAELVLDPRPTIVGRPADRAIYAWSYRNFENGTAGYIGRDEVLPSESVVRRVPLSTFDTKGTTGYVEVKLNLEVSGVRGDPQGRSTLSKSITRAVRVAQPPDEPPKGPDLVVEETQVNNSSGPVTVGTGERIRLSATVRNRGQAGAASTTLRYRYRQGSRQHPGTQVDTDPVTSLSRGGASDEFESVDAPSAPGTYRYWACVDEVAGESNTGNNCSPAEDTVTVVVRAVHVNNEPVAEVKYDDHVYVPGERVRVDGRGSHDPDGDALTYRWTQLKTRLPDGRRVDGPPARIVDSRGATTEIVVPRVDFDCTTLNFRLTVEDDHGAEDYENFSVGVRLPSQPGCGKPE